MSDVPIRPVSVKRRTAWCRYTYLFHLNPPTGNCLFRLTRPGQWFALKAGLREKTRIAEALY
jgi:hypothetical protein